MISIFATLALALAPACGDDKAGGSNAGAAAPDFKAEDSADNLKAFFGELQKAIDAGDTKRAAAFTRSVLPTKTSVAKALKDGQDEFASKVVAMIEKMTPPDDAKVATLFAAKPGRSELQVHGASSEDIAARAPSAGEFPGGASELAKTVLRPGVTFYEVEQLEPGKSSGMKFHLFFFDGTRWVMLGPAWRANR